MKFVLAFDREMISNREPSLYLFHSSLYDKLPVGNYSNLIGELLSLIKMVSCENYATVDLDFSEYFPDLLP